MKAPVPADDRNKVFTLKLGRFCKNLFLKCQCRWKDGFIRWRSLKGAKLDSIQQPIENDSWACLVRRPSRLLTLATRRPQTHPDQSRPSAQRPASRPMLRAARLVPTCTIKHTAGPSIFYIIIIRLLTSQ